MIFAMVAIQGEMERKARASMGALPPLGQNSGNCGKNPRRGVAVAIVAIVRPQPFQTKFSA